MTKKEIIEFIKVVKNYHRDLWHWYYDNKNTRDKRLEHFHKMQVLEDILHKIGEDEDGNN